MIKLIFVEKTIYYIVKKKRSISMHNNKAITFLSFFFLFLILVIGITTYQNENKALLKSIDQELLAGAHAVSTLLEKNYHHRGLHSISKEKELQQIQQLQNYVKHSNLAYIYSFIKDKNGDIRFSSSSAPVNELANNDEELNSFDLYNDKTVAKVFKTNQLIFQNTSDNLGHFRSVYIPMKAQDGSTYVVGADYKIKDIESLQENLKEKIFWTFVPLITLILIYFLIVLFNLKKAHKTIHTTTKQLQKVFEIDKLTSLPNRAKLLKYIHSHPNLMLAILDINNFKAINEIYGVKLADKFLIYLAYEILSLIKYDMNLYKLNNDLFCITSTNINKKYFQDYISTLLAKMEKIDYKDGEYTIRATYTAGISHTKNIGNPLLAAEYALKNAKKTGQKVLTYIGNYEEIHETTDKRKILDDINYAIKNKKFFPYFQPIYNVQTKAITKYEALVRMQKEDGDIVAPWYFLQTAIDTGLYKHISNIMLHSVIRSAKLHPELEFSINISALDIENEEIKKNILQTIRANRVERQITLEILESEDFTDYQTLVNFTKEVKEQNIKLSIDDFGSGYSNFANLIEIQFDYLKIDGSLVKNILKDMRYEVIIKQILSFAEHLNFLVIAEFVEDEPIAQKLTELGVVLLQGYYIGKPSEKLNDGLSI